MRRREKIAGELITEYQMRHVCLRISSRNMCGNATDSVIRDLAESTIAVTGLAAEIVCESSRAATCLGGHLEALGSAIGAVAYPITERAVAVRIKAKKGG